MKMLAFASRNLKEIVRDKLNLMFGILFPTAVLLLLSAIQANVPVELFAIEKITPGIAIFGLSFISLFSGMIIAKDRESSLMMRLLVSPLTSADFILGYTLPMLPVALAQTAICYIIAFFLGLPISWNVLLAIVLTIPAAILFIAIGLLTGSVFNDKQVGGVCGALLTNVSAWLSGTWFDLNLVGGGFKAVADCLPFSRAVDMGRAALYGNYDEIPFLLLFVSGYAVVMMIISIFIFTHKMKTEKN